MSINPEKFKLENSIEKKPEGEGKVEENKPVEKERKEEIKTNFPERKSMTREENGLKGARDEAEKAFQKESNKKNDKNVEEKEVLEEKEKKQIETITKSSLFNRDGKIELLLTYLSEKPTCSFSVSKYHKEKRKEYKSLLEELNLPYRVENDKDYEFFVGRKEKDVLDLIKHWEEKSGKMALALGYPESAVQSFEGGDPRFPFEDPPISKEEKKKLIKEGTFKFLTFWPSEKNWREEIKVAKRYQRVIKEKAPDFYEEIMKKGHDRLTESYITKRIGKKISEVTDPVVFKVIQKIKVLRDRINV